MSTALLDPQVREKILAVEKIMAQHPEAKFGNCYPLKHTFGEGIYVREITVPAGELIVTRLFRQEHATFLLKGEVSIMTEEGPQRVSAPYSMITKAGTKRIIFTHSEVIWTTVHANPTEERDIEALENFITVESYEELGCDSQNLVGVNVCQ